MRRVALTVRAEDVEDVLDELLPLLPRGVHPAETGDGLVELAAYGDDLPPLGGIAKAVAIDEQEAPDDPRERRRRFARTWEVAGRLAIRPPGAPPNARGLPELVIASPAGAFGTGAHPTTRMCLELLLALEPAGGFADLGCGAGVLAIAAARLGYAPVFAVDHEPRSVEAAARNARANGAEVEAIRIDLTTVPPPPAPTLAANVPPAIHAHVARGLDPAVARVIASGITGADLSAVLAGYARAGLQPTDRRGGAGWRAVLLERARPG